MSPKNPESRRYMSSVKRGYHNLSLKPEEWADLAKAIGDPETVTPAEVKRYLMELHMKAKEPARQ